MGSKPSWDAPPQDQWPDGVKSDINRPVKSEGIGPAEYLVGYRSFVTAAKLGKAATNLPGLARALWTATRDWVTSTAKSTALEEAIEHIPPVLEQSADPTDANFQPLTNSPSPPPLTPTWEPGSSGIPTSMLESDLPSQSDLATAGQMNFSAGGTAMDYSAVGSDGFNEQNFTPSSNGAEIVDGSFGNLIPEDTSTNIGSSLTSGLPISWNPETETDDNQSSSASDLNRSMESGEPAEE